MEKAEAQPSIARFASVALDRSREINSAVEQVQTLFAVATHEVERMLDAMRTNGLSGASMAEYEDWGNVEALFIIAGDISRVATSAAEEIEMAAVAVERDIEALAA